jgi:hypothetical protein
MSDYFNFGCRIGVATASDGALAHAANPLPLR